MRRLFFLSALFAVLTLAALGFQGQNPPPQPAPTADPYVNNAAPGATKFPLAASAGKDNNAREVAASGAVNHARRGR